MTKWLTDSKTGIKLAQWVKQNAPAIRKRAFKAWVDAHTSPSSAGIRKTLSWSAKWKLIQDWETKSKQKKKHTLTAWLRVNHISDKTWRNWQSPEMKATIQKLAMYPKHSRKRLPPGRYADAERKLNDFVVERRAEVEFLTADRIKLKMLEIMRELHSVALTERQKNGKRRFAATNRWLMGYKSGRRHIAGWATRFGWSLRISTKKKSFDMDELIRKVKRFHWWCVNLMAKPAEDEKARDPLYGKYPGTARLHLDQVPIGFNRLFHRTIAEKASKVVQVRVAHKELEKRFATLVYVARAEGRQPPPILVLAGKPFVKKPPKGLVKVIDTRIPASTIIKNEMGKYAKGVWIYYDPKSRTSQAVLRDILTDLKKWRSRKVKVRKWFLD